MKDKPRRQNPRYFNRQNLQHDGVISATNNMSAVRSWPAVDRVMVEKYRVKLRASHLVGLEKDCVSHPQRSIDIDRGSERWED